MPRRHARPGAPSLLGSLILHAMVGLAIWASNVLQPQPMAYQSFAIDIFSPPPAIEAEEMQPGSPQEELVVAAAPEAAREPPAPEPEPEKPPTPAPPRPQPPRNTEPARAATPPPPNPDSTRRGQPAAGPGAVANSPGGENINIRMEGLRRDYPEYYQNIVFQINRCFQRPREGRWVTVVAFVINRDGSVTDIQMTSRSGNAAFDIQAIEAVDCAGQRGRLGSLPTDMPYDRLPIQFTFSPAGP